MPANRPTVPTWWLVPVLAIGVLAAGCSRATFHGIEDARAVCDAASRALSVVPDRSLNVQPGSPARATWELGPQQTYRVYCEVTPARDGQCSVWLQVHRIGPGGASTRQEDYERFVFAVMADMLAEATVGAPSPTQTHNQRTTTILPVRVRRRGEAVWADFPDETPTRLLRRVHEVNPALVWPYGQFGAVLAPPAPWGLALDCRAPGGTAPSGVVVPMRVESVERGARITMANGDAVQGMALLRNLVRWLRTHPAPQANGSLSPTRPTMKGPSRGAVDRPDSPGTSGQPSDLSKDGDGETGRRNGSGDPPAQPEESPATQPAQPDRPDWRVGPPPPPQPDFE